MKIKLIAVSALLTSLVNASVADKNSEPYYWFYMRKNVTRSGPKPSSLKNADVSHPYILTTTTSALPSLAQLTTCNGSHYYCIAAFTAAQLTANHNYLKTSSTSSQTSVTAGYTCD